MARGRAARRDAFAAPGWVTRDASARLWLVSQQAADILSKILSDRRSGAQIKMASRGLRAGRSLLSRYGAVLAGSSSASQASAAAAATGAAAGSAGMAAPFMSGIRASGSLYPAAVRGMAGGAHTEAVTHAGLTLHKPLGWQQNVGTALSALMWFWVFVRAYHDWDVLIFGPEIHLKHELDEEDH